MEKIEKKLAGQVRKANAEADIALINQHTMKELTPDDVFVFSVNLCNNEIDRDMEQIPDTSLEELAKLFVGKPGIFDHIHSAKNQTARIYRCEVVSEQAKTSIGMPLKNLRADAYMLRNSSNKKTIEAIEGGILKEVSVGFATRSCTCSICGAQIWACEHMKGKKYDGQLCFGKLDSPVDAYEFSFVAVPSQRGAGVTKSAEDAGSAFEILLTADLSGERENIEKLMPVLQRALMDNDELLERAEIRKAAEKILSEKEGK